MYSFISYKHIIINISYLHFADTVFNMQNPLCAKLGIKLGGRMLKITMAEEDLLSAKYDRFNVN